MVTHPDSKVNISHNIKKKKKKMARCCQIVFGEMDLSLNDGELIAEVSESVVLSTVTLQFGGGIPVVEVGDGAAEGMEGWGRSDKEGLEPARECLGDLHG
jgi:hypothetical protein